MAFDNRNTANALAARGASAPLTSALSGFQDQGHSQKENRPA